MKIKRFLASDMRTAIRLVQEEQGPDAVILSNRRVGGQIEVVAATDYDESLVHQALKAQAAQEIPERQSGQDAGRAPDRPVAAEVAAELDVCEPVQGAGLLRQGRNEAATAPRIVWAQDPHLDKLERELCDLRNMLDSRLGQVEDLAWETRAPQRSLAVRALQDIGVDVAVARSLVEKLPEGKLPEGAPVMALRMLGRRIPLLAEDLLQCGRVLALVGPTGVGKTTTIAKLAASYAMRNGVSGVTLISTDDVRIGAQEQLRTYGRLLGAPVIVAPGGEALRAAVEERRQRGLVLVDTAGMGPRDRALRTQFDALERVPELSTLLCIAASGHAADIKAAMLRFAPTGPCGCILTKLDETLRPGAALSAIISTGLPLGWYTDGQNVPADLHRAAREPLLRIAAARLRALRAAAAPQEPARACA